ncbi:MAG: hypothetical protein KDC84_13750 [Crocinitomicaceae bacterium]|nr:hypothetical protein [Crocinitomicaceae bacterium]
MRKHIIILLLGLFFSLNAFNQAHVLVFGLQYKPIIPTNIFGAGKFDVTSDNGKFNVLTKQKFGNVFGGVVRVGFNKWVSLETGINYVMRMYSTTYSVPDSNITAVNDFKVTSYQIPISCLVYVKLSEMFHMNVALGISGAIFPSDISTLTETGDNTKMSFLMEGQRKSWFQGTFDANVGFELRTKKIGYFYLGASYQLPFTNIMQLAYDYRHSGNSQELVYTKLNGAYLTADIRYFFPENPEKKRKWEEQKEKYRQEQERKRRIRQAKKEARKKLKEINNQ